MFAMEYRKRHRATLYLAGDLHLYNLHPVHYYFHIDIYVDNGIGVYE
jgi:hypothetical protein